MSSENEILLPPAHAGMLSRVRVILVRPQVSGNVGSIARVMENFAVGPLVLVAPEANHLSRESLARSTHGEARLHGARIVSTLNEGLEGVVWAVAASRRPGPVHQKADLLPDAMAQTAITRLQADPGDVALVFGQEDNGLSREDLLACDAVVQIPGQPAYPTFNLAHAAVICLYEVFLAVAGSGHVIPKETVRHEAADAALVNRLIDKMQHALLTIGYLNPQKPDHLMFPIRNILSRSKLTRGEAQILIGLAQQIQEFAQYGK